MAWEGTGRRVVHRTGQTHCWLLVEIDAAVSLQDKTPLLVLMLGRKAHCRRKNEKGKKKKKEKVCEEERERESAFQGQAELRQSRQVKHQSIKCRALVVIRQCCAVPSAPNVSVRAWVGHRVEWGTGTSISSNPLPCKAPLFPQRMHFPPPLVESPDTAVAGWYRQQWSIFD